jgi:hypothetical protein
MAPPKPTECSTTNPDCAREFGVIGQSFIGISAQFKALGGQLGSIDEKITQVHSSLFGCDERTGLMIMVDRLQQAQSRQKWWTRAIAMAVLAALFGELALKYGH